MCTRRFRTPSSFSHIFFSLDVVCSALNRRIIQSKTLFCSFCSVVALKCLRACGRSKYFLFHFIFAQIANVDVWNILAVKQKQMKKTVSYFTHRKLEQIIFRCRWNGIVGWCHRGSKNVNSFIFQYGKTTGTKKKIECQSIQKFPFDENYTVHKRCNSDGGKDNKYQSVGR